MVAVDLPSGLSADDSAPIGPVIEAALTVTFAAPKLPLMLPPGEDLAGSLVVADIGIPSAVIDDLPGPRIEAVLAEDVRPLLETRARDAHKGQFGHALIAAGSRGKTGAAHLGAMAALRSGAGLVSVATPACCLPIVASMGAEYMTVPLEDLPDGTVARSAADALLGGTYEVIAAGPGLGTGPDQCALVSALLERSTAPLVLDADALTAMAANAARFGGRRPAHRDHAAPGRDGQARRPVGARRAAPARERGPRLRDHAPRVRDPEGLPHPHRHAGRCRLHQSRPVIPAWPPAARVTC